MSIYIYNSTAILDYLKLFQFNNIININKAHLHCFLRAHKGFAWDYFKTRNQSYIISCSVMFQFFPMIPMGVVVVSSGIGGGSSSSSSGSTDICKVC